MVMLVAASKKKKKKKKRNHKEEEIKCNVDDSNKEKEHIQGIMSTSSSSWSIVMIPKRGTTLEVNVPWNESSLLMNKSATITSMETMNHIIVRLEN
jgi:hypothetical protein